jgi:hypothetical protein
MTDVFTIRNNAIEEALQTFAPTVMKTGPATWQALLSNGALLPVTAWTDQEWLRLDAPLDAVVGEKNISKLLRWNARLGGQAKFAVAAYSRALHLRAELLCPVESESEEEFSSDFRRRLSDTGDGFRTASALLHGESVAATSEMGRSAAGVVEAQTCDLVALCRAGWSATERLGKVVVELDAGAQAIIESHAGEVFVRSPLARTAHYSDISREALGLLLLTASGIVRMVRPAADDESNQTGEMDKDGARLEARFSSRPSLEELSSAFSAMRIASRHFRREAEVLQIEEVARQYLASHVGARTRRSASSQHPSNGGRQYGYASINQANART